MQNCRPKRGNRRLNCQNQNCFPNRANLNQFTGTNSAAFTIQKGEKLICLRGNGVSGANYFGQDSAAHSTNFGGHFDRGDDL